MQKTAANPQLKWAQRKDKVYITFDLIEVQDPQIDIVDGKVLKFSGSDKNHTYSLELELFEEISKEDSKYVFATRNIFLNLKKKEKGPYWPRLTKLLCFNSELTKLRIVGICSRLISLGKAKSST